MPYTPEQRDDIIDRVFARIEKGTSLREACRDIGVAWSSVLRWCDQDDATSDRYARARAGLVDHRVNELHDIADEATPETAAVAKLRIDTRKWELARIMHRNLGDRIQNEHTGKDGGPIQQVTEVVRRIVGD